MAGTEENEEKLTINTIPSRERWQTCNKTYLSLSEYHSTHLSILTNVEASDSQCSL